MKRYTSEEQDKMFKAFMEKYNLTEDYVFQTQEDADRITKALLDFEKEYCAEHELALSFDDMLYMAFNEE